MTWYRMFPEVVSKIYAAVITKNFQELGPLLVKDNVISPDVVDEKTLKVIDIKNASSIEPAS